MPASKKLFKQRATTIASFQEEKKPQVADNAATAVSASVATPAYKPVMIRQKGKTPYWDFSDVLPPPGYKPPTRIQDMNFAEKIFHMLSDPEFVHFITWMSHGRAFKVLVPQLFEIHVCPRYFGYKRYALFRRDLEEHGFEYISSGRDRSCKWKMTAIDERRVVDAEDSHSFLPLTLFLTGYYHECLLQHRFHLCKLIKPRTQQERKPAAAAMAAANKTPPLAFHQQQNNPMFAPSAVYTPSGALKQAAPLMNTSAAIAAALLKEFPSANATMVLPAQQAAAASIVIPPSNALGALKTFQVVSDTEDDASRMTTKSGVSRI